MHELSVCQSMLQQIESIAAENRAISVHRIQVRIGPLSGIEPELLAQAFPLAAAGSVADGATLETEMLPIRVTCQSCGRESEASMNNLVCRYCGDWQTTLVSGDEMVLASLELEK